MSEARRIAWLAAGLVIVSALVVMPMAPAVLLAMWAAVLLRGAHRRLGHVLGGRIHLAAVFATAILLTVAIPAIVIVASIATDAYAVASELVRSGRFIDMTSTDDPLRLLIEQRAQAWTMVTSVAGTATDVGIGVFVVIAGTYATLVEGDAWWTWIRRHAPLAPETLDRFGAAFVETGRGLLIGIGGAGLLQALVATGAFVALDVPHAFALGLLTFVASVIPAVGTALVWMPVAVGLAATGDRAGAIAMVAIGILLISSIDNLVRPWLARRGDLRLPSFVVLIAMFGGVAAMGGWGVLVGPLVVRLAKEALEVRTELAPNGA